MQCLLPTAHVASTQPSRATIPEAAPRQIVQPQSPYAFVHPQMQQSCQNPMCSPRKSQGAQGSDSVIVKPAAVILPPRSHDEFAAVQEAVSLEARFPGASSETQGRAERVQLNVASFGQSLSPRRSSSLNVATCKPFGGSVNSGLISPMPARGSFGAGAFTPPTRPVSQARAHSSPFRSQRFPVDPNSVPALPKPVLPPRLVGACKSGKSDLAAPVAAPFLTVATANPPRSNVKAAKDQGSSDVVEVLRNLAAMVRSTASSMQEEVFRECYR